MNIARTTRRLVAFATSALLASSARVHSAHADAPLAEAQRAELALDIDPGATGLESADVRAAIERELDLSTVAPTPSSAAVLSIRGVGDRRVAMSFRQSNGRHVEREITLPDERERALETIGLLAVNLVRNEAADLVEAMLSKQNAEGASHEVAPVPPEFDAALAPPAIAPAGAEPTPCPRRIGFSPLVHKSSDFVCGTELAVIGNIAEGSVHGSQFAGVFNVARGDVNGVQFAPVFNQARTVRGVQAGLVNTSSGAVRGLQVGLVNVADDSDLSLGLVNIMRKGRVGVDAFAAETGFSSIALKNGGKHWHGFYGFSYRGGEESLNYGYFIGLGAHVTTPVRFLYVDFDALVFALTKDGGFPDRKGGWLAEARAVVGVHPVRFVSIYGGPTFNAYVTQDLASESPYRSRLVASAETRSLAYARWPGFAIGMTVMLGD